MKVKMNFVYTQLIEKEIEVDIENYEKYLKLAQNQDKNSSYFYWLDDEIFNESKKALRKEIGYNGYEDIYRIEDLDNKEYGFFFEN